MIFMESDKIENFVEKNILNFRYEGKGWNSIIRKMLTEFALSKWNLNQEIFGKEKNGSLHCSTFSNSLENEVFRNIKTKYEKLSKTTCQYCGEKGKLRMNWEYTLCRNCYLEKAKSEIFLKKRSNLEQCKICGYFAFSEDSCKFCGCFDYNTSNIIMSPKKEFESEYAYIKQCQMEIFIDENDEIAFNELTKGYTKSETHKILYTDEELAEYRRLVENWKKFDD